MNQDRPQKQEINLLIADDDQDDRLLFHEALKRIGASGEILFFEDGRQLLDYLFNNDEYVGLPILLQQSCIVLDLNMPRLNGRETLKIIRNSPDFNNVPIFVVSTSDSTEDKIFCTRLGITKYFVKPFTLEEFMDIMREITGFCLSHY